jgi:hypothetical protein
MWGFQESQRSLGAAPARIWNEVRVIGCLAAHSGQTKTAFGEVNFVCTNSDEIVSGMVQRLIAWLG